MGGSFSTLCSCVIHNNRTEHDLIASPSHRRENKGSLFVESEPLDETLGHSFCYVRSSARFLSPTPSDRFLSPTPSLRLDDAVVDRAKESSGFRAISGAAVSANSFTPKTVLQLDSNYDCATDANNNNNVLISGNSLNSGSSYYCVNNKSGSIVNGLFESTSLFSALPLQPAGRAGQGETGFFLSGPLERGTFSGPLDPNVTSGGGHDHVPFSAPLGGFVKNKKKRKGISGIRKKFYRGFPEKKQPWVVPVLNFVGGRKELTGSGVDELEGGGRNESGDDVNVQWALGKAGEDRVHVVVSEEHGWLFVGIYDGFNGPDAPEFLMAHLYRALYGELQGLFWEVEDRNETIANSVDVPSFVNVAGSEDFPRPENVVGLENGVSSENAGSSQRIAILDEQNHPELVREVLTIEDQGTVKRVTFEQTEQKEGRRRRLWEFLAEDDPGDGLDLSGSERFAFSLDDAISVSNAGSAVSRRWLLLSKLRLGLLSNNKHKEGHVRKLFPWSFGLENRKHKDENEDIVEEKSCRTEKKRKVGPVDHELVLNAMYRALEATEAAYLDMTDKFLDHNPELALMGSCLLVVLMRDEDVYVMNVGDSRAIVAYYEHKEVGPSIQLEGHKGNGFSGEGIVEMSAEAAAGERVTESGKEDPVVQDMKLSALQLSTDHSTSIEEEVIRIRNEHPDDNECILNDRVKGRLKVTRAFGAGFLKQPKWNDPLLEMFRNEYIGTAPYISCTPSLRHHKLCPRDQFLILSSDGLYQYLSNQEVVSYVESFMEKSPDGDPAQHLIEELLSRAAKKAGMDLQELLDIPQGDRRKYHDDVTVMVVSLEGRIWKSSGKYF